jgi:hypothetical protein
VRAAPLLGAPGGGEPAGEVRAARFAFSLLELVVVLAILLAAGALVVPFTLAQLRRGELEESCRRIEAAAMLARAEAMREQAVVELRAAWREGEPVELLVRRRRPSREAEGSAASDTKAIPVGRVLTEAVLPVGVRVLVDRSGDESGEEAEASDARGRPAEEILLVATPDGQVSCAGALRVVAERGRAMRVTINRWTGAATAEPVVAAREEGPPEKALRGPEAEGGSEGAPEESP